MKNRIGKVIAILIVCVVLGVSMAMFSACGGDDPYNNGNVKICAKHTGFGTCSVCGIDYYDALTGYIKNNGEYLSGNYVLSAEIEGVVLLIIYDYSNKEVIIGNTVSSSSAEASALLVINCVSASYLWGLTLKTGYSEYTMSGYLTAAAFTKSTATLASNSSTFPSSANSDARELAAASTKMNVLGLAAVLELTETNVSIADFGFTSF